MSGFLVVDNGYDSDCRNNRRVNRDFSKLSLLLLSRGACWFREALRHCYTQKNIILSKKSDYSFAFLLLSNGYLHNEEYFLDNSIKIYS